jgi:hypothetical protein
MKKEKNKDSLDEEEVYTEEEEAKIKARLRELGYV